MVHSIVKFLLSVSVVLTVWSGAAHAALIRYDYSGLIDQVTQLPNQGVPTSGSFQGVLIADRSTAQVNQWYTDVMWDTGDTQRFIMSDDWDFVVNWDPPEPFALVNWNGAIPAGWETWTPGNSGQDKILIQRNARAPFGLDIVTWPEWAMLLDFGVPEWRWADADNVYEPNGEGGWTVTTTRLVSVVGAIDSLSATAVPIPAAAWLFGPALALLGLMRRRLR